MRACATKYRGTCEPRRYAFFGCAVCATVIAELVELLLRDLAMPSE